ncbi:hypothetical protein Tco_0606885 [Tanacetum coccineum]
MIGFSARNMEMEPGIENMTMSEYLENEAMKERRLWDDVRSRRRTTHYDEADFSTSRRNKSNTFYYPYSHDIPPPPVQSYPKNYLCSLVPIVTSCMLLALYELASQKGAIVSQGTWETKMEPDIKNMPMSEYLEYEAAKERRLWDDVRSRRRTTHYDEADFSTSRRNKSNTFYYPYSHDIPPPPVQSYPKNYLVSTEASNDDSDLVKIMDDLFRIGDENLKQMEQDIDQDMRQFLTPNVPDVIDNIQPLIPKTIHTTPPDEDYVAPATKSILDYLLEEFEDEILNVTMVDEGAECSPTKDLEELKRLLAKDPQSHYTEIRVHSVFIDPKPFIHTQLMSPLYGMFKTSKPCKVDRDIISPGRYDFYSSFPYHVAYLHPNGVYYYFHPHLIPSEGMDTLLPSK